ncbi:MAG: DUF4157 domain-containing protein [Gammaproteobacteria bacterium]|nr:DUF4157 domain-containing protein [Gammaproteobacteria bacterium]MDH5650704.1 DUF4157 domain-containing protein [Gammaproteobacteria bacterium]
MRKTAALFSDKPAASSQTTQAQRSVFQNQADKQADNPLQQSIWQPGSFKTRAEPSRTTNTGSGFNFANIPIIAPNSMPVQAKLTIGQPNDKYEQEADRVADQVMRMPDSAAAAAPARQATGGVVQRTCATCSAEYNSAEEEDRPVDQKSLCPQCRVQAKPLADQITPLVQRQSDNALIEDDEEKDATLQTSATPGNAPVAGPGVASAIGSMQGGGQPLSPTARGFMETRFGHNFSHVRIHADTTAARISRQINARAFTVGPNIAFGAGQYQPDSPAGKKLLAHELTHVVQQGAVSPVIQRQSETPMANVTQQGGNNIDNQIATILQAKDMLQPRLAEDESGEIANHIRNLDTAHSKLMQLKNGGNPEEEEQIAPHLAPLTQPPTNPDQVAPLIQRKAINPQTDTGLTKHTHTPWSFPVLKRGMGTIQRVAAVAAAPLVFAGPPGWVILAVAAVGVAVVGGVYLATRPRTIESTRERAEPRVRPRTAPMTCATMYPQAISCAALPGLFTFSSSQAALRSLVAETGISNLRLVSARTSTGGPCPGVGMHYGVKAGGTYIASISCCPCCMDTPTGPVMTTLCRII